MDDAPSRECPHRSFPQPQRPSSSRCGRCSSSRCSAARGWTSVPALHARSMQCHAQAGVGSPPAHRTRMFFSGKRDGHEGGTRKTKAQKEGQEVGEMREEQDVGGEQYRADIRPRQIQRVQRQSRKHDKKPNAAAAVSLPSLYLFLFIGMGGEGVPACWTFLRLRVGKKYTHRLEAPRPTRRNEILFLPRGRSSRCCIFCVLKLVEREPRVG